MARNAGGWLGLGAVVGDQGAVSNNLGEEK